MMSAEIGMKIAAAAKISIVTFNLVKDYLEKVYQYDTLLYQVLQIIVRKLKPLSTLVCIRDNFAKFDGQQPILKFN